LNEDILLLLPCEFCGSAGLLLLLQHQYDGRRGRKSISLSLSSYSRCTERYQTRIFAFRAAKTKIDVLLAVVVLACSPLVIHEMLIKSTKNSINNITIMSHYTATITKHSKDQPIGIGLAQDPNYGLVISSIKAEGPLSQSCLKKGMRTRYQQY